MTVIGRLDRRIEIQEPAITRDSFGGETVAWVNFATVWAEYTQTAADERFQNEANRELATRRARFRIRHRPGIDERMRVVYDERAFNIKGIQPWGRNDNVILFCEAPVDGSFHTFTDFTVIGGLSADAIPMADELTINPVGSALTFQAFTDMHILLWRPATEDDITAVILDDDPTRENQVGAFTKHGSTVTRDGVDGNVWVSNQLLTYTEDGTLRVQ